MRTATLRSPMPAFVKSVAARCRKRSLWLLTAMMFVASSALAQGSPSPDPKRFPELASLQGWMKGKTREARACSANVRFSVLARTLLDRTKSEEQVAAALEKPVTDASAGRATPPQVRKLAASYARTAALFSPLTPDAAGIAIAQMCRSATERLDQPFVDEAMIKALVGKAKGCAAPYAKVVFGTLECVAKTMKAR